MQKYLHRIFRADFSGAPKKSDGPTTTKNLHRFCRADFSGDPEKFDDTPKNSTDIFCKNPTKLKKNLRRLLSAMVLDIPGPVRAQTRWWPPPPRAVRSFRAPSLRRAAARWPRPRPDGRCERGKGWVELRVKRW